MPQIKFWNEERTQLLVNEYADSNLKELAVKLGCSYGAMLQKASALKISKNDLSAWTKSEEDYLKKHFAKKDNEAIAEQLNKTVLSIRNKAFMLKLSKNHGWTIIQEKYLLENYRKISIEELIINLKKSKWGIINKHRELTGKRKTNDKTIISGSILK